MRAACVIPARLASSRLPGKPLLDVHGKPMWLRTAEAAMSCDRFELVVLAHDPDISAATLTSALEASGHERTADQFKAPLWVYKSGPDRPTGTDRVAALAGNEGRHVRSRLEGIDCFVNLQVDEPEISPESLSTIVDMIEGGAKMATLAADREIKDEDYRNQNEVFVGTIGWMTARMGSDQGVATTFFRGGLHKMPACYFNPHVGVYAFRRDALLRFAAHGQTEQEKEQRLEQLRAFEMDPPLTIRVAVVPHEGRGINTREDYEALLERWKDRA